MGLAAPAPLKVRALVCPNCGGSVALRGYGHSVNAVCEHCLTVLDTTTPSLAVLQKYGKQERIDPKIPLGSRGKLEGAEFEVIGFQVRTITVDGIDYSWSEYLLFHPYKGYRYLSEYQGHWNYIRTVNALPLPLGSFSQKKRVKLDGRVYTHFQRANATTTYVLGEFPWQVRVGDKVQADDFVSPPYLLSSESVPGETTWSRGEYMAGQQIQAAFGLPGKAEKASGIFANQPSPYSGKVKSIWGRFGLMLVLLACTALVVGFLHRNEKAFDHRYSYASTTQESSFVTPVFELKGRKSGVKIQIDTDLNNDWAFFGLALINEVTGEVFDTGKEISFYRDSEGSEGSTSGSVLISEVPAGRYYLRVEPDMQESISSVFSQARPSRSVNYRLAVYRDPPAHAFYWAALILMLVPPLWVTYRAFVFENRRWAESDYGALIQSSSEDD